MTSERPGLIVICGATGRQGGAVTRHLLRDGWRVRGLTRNVDSPKAKALADAGADVVKADMADRAALDRAFEGAYGVYNVQNPMIAGFEGEVAQGRNVADAAKAAGVQHVVYGAAGVGEKTGVPSWDTKVEITEHMRRLGLPLTVLRPNAFMELMTDKAYYPQASIWHVMPTLMGWNRNVPWLAVDDLGAIAARVFGQPGPYLGREIPLGADVRTLEDTRAVWAEVTGHPPRRFPMPVWLFERVAGVAGKDLPVMWRWLRSNSIPEDTAPTFEILPNARSVKSWLQEQRGGGEARPS